MEKLYYTTAKSQYAPSGRSAEAATTLLQPSNLFRKDAVAAVEHKDEAVEGDG